MNAGSADNGNKDQALRYGIAYAKRTGKRVHFFSAPDPERIETGGCVSLRFGRRLWLWTVKPQELDGEGSPWRREQSYPPASSNDRSQQ